jgi:hypothetical protein
MLACKHYLWHTSSMAKTKKEFQLEFARVGAKARAEALTPERRKAIARKAAQARWKKGRVMKRAAG